VKHQVALGGTAARAPKAVAVVLANQNARIIWATIATRDALREKEFAAA